MLQNIKHNYPRPQRGRMSATSQGGGLFDPYRVGDASFPFFLERGIPSEFVLIGSLIIVPAFYETPLGPPVYFCSFFLDHGIPSGYRLGRHL